MYEGGGVNSILQLVDIARAAGVTCHFTLKAQNGEFIIIITFDSSTSNIAATNIVISNYVNAYCSHVRIYVNSSTRR